MFSSRTISISRLGNNVIIKLTGELSGINRNIQWEDIAMVATCLGPEALAAVCRRLAVNYKYAHSGFPDLTLWNETTRKVNTLL